MADWTPYTPPPVPTPEDLAALVASANEAEAEHTRAIAAEDRARRAWHDAHERLSLARAAPVHAEMFAGLEHLECAVSAYSPRYRARRDGLPVVVGSGGSTATPAKCTDEVGPGPALEGMVVGGRKWRPLADIPRFSRVRQWRLAEVLGG